MPWLQSSTHSASGHRVFASRPRRSSRSLSGTAIQNGRISVIECLPTSFWGAEPFLVDVGLVDEGGTRQRRLAAPDDVLVRQVQPQRVDSKIPLQERLLVNGPPDGAA